MQSKLKVHIVVQDVEAIDSVLQKVQRSGLADEIVVQVERPARVSAARQPAGWARRTVIQGL